MDSPHRIHPETLRPVLMARGIRATLQRMYVLWAVQCHTPTDGVLSPDQVFKAVYEAGYSMALSQVYAALALMSDAGLIQRYRPGDGQTLFAPVRGAPYSAVFVCVRCRRVQGFREGVTANDLLNALAAEGHRPTERLTVLRGHCVDCVPGTPLASEVKESSGIFCGNKSHSQ